MFLHGDGSRSPRVAFYRISIGLVCGMASSPLKRGFVALQCGQGFRSDGGFMVFIHFGHPAALWVSMPLRFPFEVVVCWAAAFAVRLALSLTTASALCIHKSVMGASPCRATQKCQRYDKGLSAGGLGVLALLPCCRGTLVKATVLPRAGTLFFMVVGFYCLIWWYPVVWLPVFSAIAAILVRLGIQQQGSPPTRLLVH